jgi:hypothetical protein
MILILGSSRDPHRFLGERQPTPEPDATTRKSSTMLRATILMIITPTTLYSRGQLPFIEKGYANYGVQVMTRQ